MRGGRKAKVSRWYRLVIKTRETREEVLSSRAGRFHEEMDTEPPTYVAEALETAWREVAAHLGAVPANPAAFRLYRVTVRNVKLANLTDLEERTRYQITAAELAADLPPPQCKEIARALRQAGYHGILYPSVRNPLAGRCVALFLERANDLITIAPAEKEWTRFIKRGRK